MLDIVRDLFRKELPLDDVLLEAIRQYPHGVSSAVLLEAVGLWTPIGAIHVALDRLEETGRIRSYQKPGGPERGGRSQRIVVAT